MGLEDKKQDDLFYNMFGVLMIILVAIGSLVSGSNPFVGMIGAGVGYFVITPLVGRLLE